MSCNFRRATMAMLAVLAAPVALAAPAALAAQNLPPIPAAPPVVTTPAQCTAAQAAAQAATGKAVSNDQIFAAIKNSGLSQQQIQARLQAAGYDPSLANPYFGAGAGGGAGTPGAAGAGAGAAATGCGSDFANALNSLGLLSTPSNDAKTEETIKSNADKAVKTEETIKARADKATSRMGSVFGKDIFARSTTVFDPVTAGPVDPAYRLGVGDQLQLVVTGQVELAYQLDLRRDGTVIIPQVGQLPLSGLTLDAARTVLKERMGKSYSGLNSGEAKLDLSITRVRSNAVFVIGEVESPGAYQVNALSTVFHAIARAGGPTDRGTFRSIEVRRANKVIQKLDLYDYLLKGDAAGDIRLEQGDVIYVPLNTRVVAAIGAVRRPRVFELKETEGFADLLRFAGDLLATASVERVQVDRILPADRRTPGFDRVKVDVEIKGRLDSLARVRLLDGDIVQVFTIGDVRRNVVSVFGQVFQPGEYELRPAMTLGKLLDDAQGLQPWALADRVKIVRQLPLTGRSTVHNVDVSSVAGKAFLMEEFDAIEVLDARLAFAQDVVSVQGAVNVPMVRAFSERESLRDAIERSGGVKEEAQKVQVSRKRFGATYSDTTSVRFAFDIGPNFARDTTLRGFILERNDHVVVLSSPGYRAQQFVTVRGQFKYPGVYGITENLDHVRDIVLRAGDVLPSAYAESFHLIRDGRDVSVDFARAMRSDNVQNIGLLGGDQLIVDRDPNTVLVTGAVSRPSLIRFRRGFSAQDYIELAGGPTETGNAGNAVVNSPSGYSERVKRVAFFWHVSPEVVSGATVIVPERPVNQANSGESWQRVIATTTALASFILAYSAIKR